MTPTKVLELAIKRKNHELAALALVYGVLKTQIKDTEKNGKKRSPTGQSKRT
jgi:hypothetical protein